MAEYTNNYGELLAAQDSKGGVFNKINYIKLMNWTWEELPFLEGCKASSIVLFLAVVDSINRNRWTKTSIPYDYLINKCKFSKQVYLDARQWLINNDLLEVQLGRNGYQMALFDLGIAVRNQTAIVTSTDTTELPSDGTANRTATRTHFKTGKQGTKKLQTLNIAFDIFWDLYDHKKGRQVSEKLWHSLTDEERQNAIEHIPKYKEATKDKTYRQAPKRYLSEKTFNDEITLAYRSAIKNYSAILQQKEYGTREPI